MSSDNYDIYDALNSFNINYIIDYIFDNYIQLILLVCVFFIIYIVDRINQYNNIIFGLSSIPGIPIPGQQNSNLPNISNKINKKRKQNK